MKFNDYIEGKDLYEELINDDKKYTNHEINEKFNEVLREQSLGDFIKECQIANVDFINESINEAKGGGGTNPFKKLIGRKKIKNLTKKYANAYLAWKMVDLEERKIMLKLQKDEADQNKKDQAKDAFKIKRKEAEELVTATAERMDIIGKNFGVPNYATNWRSLAKVNAIKKVLQMAKGVYTDSAYAEMETQFKDLKMSAAEAKVKLDKDDKADKNMTFADVKAGYEKQGYTKTFSKEPTAEDKEKYDVVKATGKENKDSDKTKEVWLGKAKEQEAADTKEVDLAKAQKEVDLAKTNMESDDNTDKLKSATLRLKYMKAILKREKVSGDTAKIEKAKKAVDTAKAKHAEIKK